MRKTLIITATLALAGCNLGNTTGFAPTQAEIATVQTGVDTKASIHEKFGRPSIEGASGTTWYYIAQFRKYPGSLPTREVVRRVFEVKFSGERVESTREYTREDGQDIDLTNDVTETGGRKLTFMEQFMGGIGNFSAEDFLN